MNSFPESINVKNISNFPSINCQRIKSILREEIHNLILTRKDENVYVDLDVFLMKHCNRKTCLLEKIVIDITKELHDLGWKTKLGFGETGLFVYSTENPPSSCW
jgi:hypothetical protein